MAGNPARRASPAVYRRRRLGVLAVAVLVAAAIAAGVWLAVAQPWAAATGPVPATSASPTPTGSPGWPQQPFTASSDEPTPSSSPTPELVACTASDVEVTAVTDAETYGADALPQLSIALTSVSDRPCTINVGSSMQKYTITSGSDVWWRSTDCQTEPSDMIVTLEAGATVSNVTPVVWDRTRSSVDTCEEETRPRAPGGGASYHLAVSIGGFDSLVTRQIILR